MVQVEVYRRVPAAPQPALPVSSSPGVSHSYSIHPRLGSKMAQAGQEKDVLAKVGEVSVQVLGVLSILLVVVWSVHFRGGLAWSTDNKGLIFNVSRKCHLS